MLIYVYKLFVYTVKECTVNFTGINTAKVAEYLTLENGFNGSLPIFKNGSL